MADCTRHPPTEGTDVDGELVDQERAEAGECDQPERGDHPLERPIGRETESQAEARQREAMDDAKADAHRDEPPFNT